MKKSILLFVVFGAILLASCSLNQTIEDEVSATLREMAEIEKVFEGRQDDLQDIEQAEQKIFFETMALTREQTAEVKEKVKELNEALEERVIKIAEEAEAMQEANALVIELSTLEEKATGNEIEAIEKIKKAADYRYDTHRVFVEHYERLTNLQKTLYEMLVEDTIDALALDKHVEDINTQNQKVKWAVEDFNEATIDLNETREEVFNHLKKE